MFDILINASKRVAFKYCAVCFTCFGIMALARFPSPCPLYAVTAAAVATPAPASLKATVAPVEGQMDVNALFIADKAGREPAFRSLPSP